MVAKNKTVGKRGKVEVGKLNLKKETVKDLPGSQQKQIKGGLTLHPMACSRNASGCI